MGEQVLDTTGFEWAAAKAFGDGTKRYVVAYTPDDQLSVVTKIYDEGGTLLTTTTIWEQFDISVVSRLNVLGDLEVLNGGDIILVFSLIDNDTPFDSNIYHIALSSDGTTGTLTLSKNISDDDVDYLCVGAFSDGKSVVYYQIRDADTDIKYVSISAAYAVLASGTLTTANQTPREFTALALSNGKAAFTFGYTGDVDYTAGAVLGVLSDATTFSTALFSTALTARTFTALGETSGGNIVIASSESDASKDGYAIYQQDNTEVLGATLVGEKALFGDFISRIDSNNMLLIWGGHVGSGTPKSVRVMKITEAGVLVDSIATIFTDSFLGVKTAACETPDSAYAVICWNEPSSNTVKIGYTQLIGGAMPYWGVPPVDIITYKRLVVAANNKIWYESI